LDSNVGGLTVNQVLDVLDSDSPLEFHSLIVLFAQLTDSLPQNTFGCDLGKGCHQHLWGRAQYRRVY